MNIFSLVIWFPIFVVAVIISFFLPGFIIIKSQKIESHITKFLVSTILGLVLWGIQGYIFGYAGIRFATYIYLLFSFLLGIKNFKEIRGFFREVSKEVISLNKLILFLLVFGVIIQLIPVAGSGLQYTDGVRFYSINATDGVMHLAYIQSITHFFPPREPGSYGTLIQNYHYWSDLVIAELARIWLIPIPHLFFRLMPFFVSLMTGLAVYAAIRLLGGSKTAGVWGILLNYLGGDAPFLFTLIPHRNFGFITPAIDNGALQFLNMPHAMAKMIFIIAIIPLVLWLRKKEKIWGILTTLFLSTLIGFKVYFGIYILIGFSLLVAYLLIKSKLNIKKEWFSIALLLTLYVFIAAIYLPPNRASGGLYWDPLEWPHLLLGFGGVNLTIWWSAMHFVERVHLLLFIPILEALAALIALVIIYGTRILGIISIYKIWKINLPLFVFLIPGMILFQFVGLFTMQASGGLNVYNFFAVSAVVLTLLSAFVFSEITKGRYGQVIVVGILLLTIPRVIYETGSSITMYVTQQNSYLVTNQELAALTYLKGHSLHNAIVQSHRNNHWDMRTPYVAFFSDRYSLFSGVGLQETHNTPTNNRQDTIDALFSAPNSYDLAHKMGQYGVDYLYLQKNHEETFPYELSKGHFAYVYENNEVLILKPIVK